MSPEVPIGHIPAENHRATKDGACKRWLPKIGSGVVKRLREAEGWSRVLRDSVCAPVEGGGIVGW